MSGVYGVAERARLERLADTLTAANPSAVSHLGPALANRLRMELPDLDDATIGRVLIAISRLTHLFAAEVNPAVTWAGLAAAGLQMAEGEWKDQPS